MATRISLFTDDGEQGRQRLQDAANDLLARVESKGGRLIQSRLSTERYASARAGGTTQYTVMLVYEDGEKPASAVRGNVIESY